MLNSPPPPPQQERGESFYNPIIPDVINQLEEKGLVEDSEGARVIFSKKSPKAPPLIVIKSDGGYNYASTDLAAIWHRIHVEKVQWLVYVTDAGLEIQLFDKSTENLAPPSSHSVSVLF